ncbi:ankyrin repeat domain-containing protein [Streptomyces sp. PKU-EA00015]|uniref:ankyrin repeat domain-containing protein n=1 Tax=Streptomyces sp. PKU-EA00015 TaxID=2748326 RepID=UPI0015A340F7|nr:ankyrin repeat domain-containing protein [Streptomyces sp. PKU-EA00015]NWF26266.1 ankyrin repeat domain-containing protein [Streptomyces sp. PKU-EA00015]
MDESHVDEGRTGGGTADAERAADARALFAAVYDGADDAVVRLLRAGVPAETVDEDGQTPLYLAAVEGDAGIVRLLLTAGADPDRASGPESDDLPLCGAAVGGHTEVVRALLAAGATPDRRELLGFTALTWAVAQGHAGTAEALLEHGADPDLACPSGEPPLVVAARRGSPSTVRALLRYGASARAEALAEARRWLTLDVERHLREGLLAHDPGAETVSRRVTEDGGTTVVVEVLRDGRPAAGNEQQTGHGAIATLLEEELGILTPYATLAERALREGYPDRDDWIESVTALWRRGDEETFQAAAAWCGSDDPLHQAFAADVLGQLGFAYTGTDGAGDGVREEEDGDAPRSGDARHADGIVRPFAARALPLLRELSREARDPELIQAAVTALGHHADPSALDDILRHAGHPDAAVRHRVALALCGQVPGDHAEAVATLIALSRDAAREVRDWSTTALAELDTDTPEIREALADRIDDPDADTAAEAARGLAIRQDPRAEGALVRLLADGDPESPAHGTATDAVRHIRDDRLRRRLQATLPRRP